MYSIVDKVGHKYKLSNGKLYDPLDLIKVGSAVAMLKFQEQIKENKKRNKIERAEPAFKGVDPMVNIREGKSTKKIGFVTKTFPPVVSTRCHSLRNDTMGALQQKAVVPSLAKSSVKCSLIFLYPFINLYKNIKLCAL